MYVVAQGTLTILLDGKPVETVGSGGIVGEMALIDADPRSATVVSKTDCMLIGLDRPRFVELVARQPEFALHVMGVLARRLRRMDMER
jgi:CRP-like cAMP-binding protein